MAGRSTIQIESEDIMSTRGLYTFKDADGAYTVFKHWDNYPKSDSGYGAYQFIKNALAYAWQLPRFEADEFAASFIAANKKAGGGDLRLLPADATNGDTLGVEFWYTVEADGQRLRVLCRDLFNGVDLEPVYLSASINQRKAA
jgi:uncharacterized ubiquitin-like protein YukD